MDCVFRFNEGAHSTATLARSLATSWPTAAHLEDPHHWPSLRQLERAAIAMNQSLIISLEPLAADQGGAQKQ